jgi:hypothetical protein
VTVTVAGPAAVHVKVVDAELDEDREPLDADHAYVMPAAFGATAVAVSDTLLPTVVSDGDAARPLAVAQLKACPLNAAEPESGACTEHCRSTLTLLVVLAATENAACPEQVTVPSIDALVIETE